MRHLAAYLLCALNADGASPSVEAIKTILGSVGVEANDKDLEILMKRFAGVNVENVMRDGMSLLASMPSGGGGGVAAGAGAATDETAADAPAKKEEKKEEPEEESDDDMGFGLFD
ncbi:Ribosomal protein L12 family [Trinorchestia longiramus]|nr:Ribosomal protein L12 family [Trinorchestia longiramus]